MSDQTIETILTEDRRYPPPPDFAALAVARPDIYEREFEEFWESEGRARALEMAHTLRIQNLTLDALRHLD